MGATEIILQASILALTLLIAFIAIRYLPRNPISNSKKNRSNTTIQTQTNRHLAQAAHFLARAQPNHPHFAKLALTEAEAAISLSPKDPAPLVLKSLALDHLGHKGPALRALDLAMSPPRGKSLSEKERGEALVKRAELKLAVNRKRRVDSAVEDLKEATMLRRKWNSGTEGEEKVLCLLGRCYEWKAMVEEAKSAFEQALKAQPGSIEARQGLQRLCT